MKITRSTKCSFRFATRRKKEQLRLFLVEYVRVVNLYIVLFWDNPPAAYAELKKETLNLVGETWLTQRAKQCASRQALGMCRSVRERKKDKGSKSTPKRPKLRKLKAELSANCATLNEADSAGSFDLWLHLYSLGKGIILDIPIARHSHYNDLAKAGKRLNQFVITDKSIQVPFEIRTGKKLPPVGCVGADSGIRKLLGSSTGEVFGEKATEYIEKIRRKKHGSKGQQSARRSYRQYIDKSVKDFMETEGMTLVVIEQLTGITKGTKSKKRKLGKKTRYFIGAWSVSYMLERIKQACERNRVSLRRVPAFYSSQTCPVNAKHKVIRNGCRFHCLECEYADDADITAAVVLLDRFMSGPYAQGCVALPDKRKNVGSGNTREFSDSPVRDRDNAVRQRATSLSTAFD